MSSFDERFGEVGAPVLMGEFGELVSYESPAGVVSSVYVIASELDGDVREDEDGKVRVRRASFDGYADAELEYDGVITWGGTDWVIDRPVVVSGGMCRALAVDVAGVVRGGRRRSRS